MKFSIVGLAALGLCAPAVRAADAPDRVAIKASRMIDGKSDRPIAPAVVLIEDGRIVAAGPAVPIPPGVRVIDLDGVTLLPGLIDMHAHLMLEPETLGLHRSGSLSCRARRSMAPSTRGSRWRRASPRCATSAPAATRTSRCATPSTTATSPGRACS